MSGKLVIISTSRSVVPGLLSWPAWDALRVADAVYFAEDAPKDWLIALADAAVIAHPLDAVGLGMPALARQLLADAGAGRSVVWLGSADGDPGLAQALTQRLVAGAATVEAVDGPDLEVLAGAWDRPGSAVLELAAVMDRLRSPGGCPWDAEQTHESLVPYVLEEAYEVAEAIEHGTRDDLVEELGDLLLQVVFHARVGEEAGEDAFDLDEVAEGITAKLRRRHPHVFADVHAPTADQVAANWEDIKRAEKGRKSDFDGVPVNLPALARADKVLGRFERAGLTLPDLTRLDLPSDAITSPDPDTSVTGPSSPSVTSPGALAARVIAVVMAARANGIDLEAAVRDAVRLLTADGRRQESATDTP